MTGPDWKIGVEVELLAPRGTSRRDLADRIAADVGGRVRRGLHPQSEPSLVPGMTVFESLTPSFEVLDAEGRTAVRLVDDLTLVDDLAREAAPKPGWWRIVGDDARWMRLCAKYAEPEADLPAAIAPFAAVLGTRPTPGPGGTWRVADEAGASIALAAPLPGERERPCELITAPIARDHEATLDRWLAHARALGFTAPAEGAVHLHFDGAPFRSARAMTRLVAFHAAFGEVLRRRVRTNPRCRRLGPHEAAVRDLVAEPGFAEASWEAARARLAAVTPSKFVDLNLRNVVFEHPTKPTIEVRILPVWTEAAPIVDAMCLFAAFFRQFVLGPRPIPDAPAGDATLTAVIASLDLPARAAARWGQP